MKNPVTVEWWIVWLIYCWRLHSPLLLLLIFVLFERNSEDRKIAKRWQSQIHRIIWLRLLSIAFSMLFVFVPHVFIWLCLVVKDNHSPAHSPPPPPPHPPHAPHESADWEPNALMEKMLRVQRDSAKKSEKIDFMEEHIQVLVAELKKKNRIVQAFLMKEDSGMMASEASDKHKVRTFFFFFRKIFFLRTVSFNNSCKCWPVQIFDLNSSLHASRI